MLVVCLKLDGEGSIYRLIGEAEGHGRSSTVMVLQRLDSVGTGQGRVSEA